jgi:chromosome partitioning protein
VGMDGQELRRIREARGWKAAELAQALNARTGRRYDVSTISRWETGAQRIPKPVAEFLKNGGLGARILVFANQKGGVGKTTASVNVAASLALDGAKVLLVDLDPQANATYYLGIDPVALLVGRQHSAGLHSMLRSDGDPMEHVHPVLDGLMHCVPTSLDMSDGAEWIARDPAGLHRLGHRLDGLKPHFDWIVIDCAPSLGTLVASAIVAADHIVLPVETEPFALLGAEMLIKNIDDNRRLLRIAGSGILGILPTKHGAKRSINEAALAQLKEDYGGTYTVFPPIPDRTIVAQSTAARQPLVVAAPGDQVSVLFRELAGAIVRLTTVGMEDSDAA